MKRFHPWWLLPLAGTLLLTSVLPALAADPSAGSEAIARPDLPLDEPVDHIAAPFPQPPPPDTFVRVAVLDASPGLERANRIAVLLTRFRRQELEAHLGMKIELANLSSIRERPAMGNVVFYRPGYLRTALLIAKAIPGEQGVRPMTGAQMGKAGIDIEILLGAPAP